MSYLGPRFIYILRDIENGAGNEWESIDMGHHDGTGMVHANPIETTRLQFLLGPFLEDSTGSGPNVFLELSAGTP